MFANIKEKPFYIFGIANAITLPMVWALYPESNQRTLEEMDLVFAADTPWACVDREKTLTWSGPIIFQISLSPQPPRNASCSIYVS
jgi:hypothetical protein